MTRRRKKQNNNLIIPKKFTIGSLIVLVAVLVYQGMQILIIEQKSSLQKDEVTTCFTPPAGCQQININYINKAQNEILMGAYSFTAKPIQLALKDALQRGVRVTIIIDKQQVKNHNILQEIIHPAFTLIVPDNVTGIFHNKIVVIDHKYLITGSSNFTNAAEFRNAENTIYTTNQYLVGKYYNYLSTFVPNHQILVYIDKFVSPSFLPKEWQQFIE
ncbi:MAG: hypothetical protein J0G32_07635 [Alphaproteobacteria bacterium]|mgnify:CR=1 FL=1|jgi:phosphatidylserine/phosphatidylglycerophosphate/cardiolipin synthase-like enzyme|nr:hypothetical protein [Alphaproteobacteria bacterium]OJV12535.1 MAG: hypothetical protein BGO27_03325 [Alphaproteobacteria bacterium 33-17]